MIPKILIILVKLWFSIRERLEKQAKLGKLVENLYPILNNGQYQDNWGN